MLAIRLDKEFEEELDLLAKARGSNRCADLCQVLGCMPDQKYENEGGPSLSGCSQALDVYSSQPILDKQTLVKWVILNYFIGNADAHGKNLSLIREIGGNINTHIKHVKAYL